MDSNNHSTHHMDSDVSTRHSRLTLVSIAMLSLLGFPCSLINPKTRICSTSSSNTRHAACPAISRSRNSLKTSNTILSMRARGGKKKAQQYLSGFLRRGRDSNPRWTGAHNSFRDCPIQPLWHLPKCQAGDIIPENFWYPFENIKIFGKHKLRITTFQAYNKKSCIQNILFTKECKLAQGREYEL
jgi:hypothetical protein